MMKITDEFCFLFTKTTYLTPLSLLDERNQWNKARIPFIIEDTLHRYFLLILFAGEDIDQLVTLHVIVEFRKIAILRRSSINNPGEDHISKNSHSE